MQLQTWDLVELILEKYCEVDRFEILKGLLRKNHLPEVHEAIFWAANNLCLEENVELRSKLIETLFHELNESHELDFESIADEFEDLLKKVFGGNWSNIVLSLMKTAVERRVFVGKESSLYLTEAEKQNESSKKTEREKAMRQIAAEASAEERRRYVAMLMG